MQDALFFFTASSFWNVLVDGFQSKQLSLQSVTALRRECKRIIKFQILLYICAIPVKEKVDFLGGNSSAQR